jgi:hypothetical protein
LISFANRTHPFLKAVPFWLVSIASEGQAIEHAISSIQIHSNAYVNQLISHANDSHNSKSACTSSVFGVILGSWPLASGSDRTSANRHPLIALRFPHHRSACWVSGPNDLSNDKTSSARSQFKICQRIS